MKNKIILAFLTLLVGEYATSVSVSPTMVVVLDNAHNDRNKIKSFNYLVVPNENQTKPFSVLYGGRFKTTDDLFSYRITKYNPWYRNYAGAFLKKEWTSINEIGDEFEGKEFTVNEYFRTEDAYVEAILLIMDLLQQDKLYVSYLEKRNLLPDLYSFGSTALVSTYTKLILGMELNKEEVAHVARLVLRGALWCKLENPNMFVHFGDNYYMFLGGKQKIDEETIKKVESLGLFVEKFQSPGLLDPDDIDDNDALNASYVFEGIITESLQKNDSKEMVSLEQENNEE